MRRFNDQFRETASERSARLKRSRMNTSPNGVTPAEVQPKGVGEQGLKASNASPSAALHGANLDAEPSAAGSVTKALDMACQYSGGISYGDGPNAELLSWADIREVIAQHSQMLAALLAHAEANRLDEEYQELCARADAEGWDEQTGGSHLSSAWVPVAAAYEIARRLEQAAIAKAIQP